MKISLIGNCQLKALTWYIQKIHPGFDAAYIWTDIGMGDWSKKDTFPMNDKWGKGLPTPTITSYKKSHDRLMESDYIIYQPIRPSRIKYFNYEDVKKYDVNSKLISTGCFYYQKPELTIKKTYNAAKSGILGMKERAEKFKLDIHIHKIIEKHGPDALSTNHPYHPKALYFLELVREICAKANWDYYSDDQYNKYLKEGFPFG